MKKLGILAHLIFERIKIASISAGDFFAAFAAAFIIASVQFVLGGDFTDLTYVQQYSFISFLLIFIAAFVVIFDLALLLRSKKIIFWCLLASAVFFCRALVKVLPNDIYFNIGLAFVLLLIVKYVANGDRLGLTHLKMSRRMSFFVTVGIFIVFFASVSVWTIVKYKSFYHSTFDFGIFCQMFDQMAKTGLPFTTVERSQYLSHFAVHFSPVFYLLLPGYMIFRSPIYLLVAQAFIVGFGMFPMRRICLSLGMSPKFAVAAVAIYALFPTMANGCFYDFHENKFLSVFILYLIYFVLEKKRGGMVLFVLLTLSVKEDAFIYVIAVALWMLVSGRDRIFALCMTLFSAAYFFFACEMIYLSGGVIMSGRFENFYISGDNGLLAALKTCVIDIGYLIREVFSGADKETYQQLSYSGQKVEFLFWTAAPLLFTPFLRKRSSELVLLLPLLIINLMPSWPYQYNVDYQYTYGTAALMLTSAILCLSEIKPERRRFFALSMLALCLIFTTSLVKPKADRYLDGYKLDKGSYVATNEALAAIPTDASVTAYGFIVPHLYGVNDLHTCPDYYSDLSQTEYYVIDTRYETDDCALLMYETMKDDYTLETEAGFIKIYRLTPTVQDSTLDGATFNER